MDVDGDQRQQEEEFHQRMLGAVLDEFEHVVLPVPEGGHENEKPDLDAYDAVVWNSYRRRTVYVEPFFSFELPVLLVVLGNENDWVDEDAV